MGINFKDFHSFSIATLLAFIHDNTTLCYKRPSNNNSFPSTLSTERQHFIQCFKQQCPFPNELLVVHESP